jgi:tetrahydromethanopterin S-methyltransferase subunit G
MSEDADSSGVTEVVRDSVGDALGVDDLESMLEGDTPQAVGRELGARVGREYGAFVGRELGAVVAVDIQERKGPRAILADVKRRLKELLQSVVQSADFRSSLSRLRDLGSAVDAGGGAVELLETVVPGEEDESEPEDSEEEDESEPEDSEEEDESEPEDSEEEGIMSEIPIDDLDDMREETYREMLEVMSYRDLQSVAKEVDVKANLSQEEMTDRIVEEFSEQQDE